MFDVQHRDERLPAKPCVLGLAVDGDARDYPFDLLAQRVGPDGRLDDRVGGRKGHIRYDATQRSAEAFDAEGRALPAVAAFWFAWVALHPRTQLLAPR